MGDDGDGIHNGVALFRAGIGVVRGAGQILDTEVLGQQDAVQRGQTEAATAVQKIRDVGLSKSGLARKKNGRQDTHIDPTPYLQPQTLV